MNLNNLDLELEERPVETRERRIPDVVISDLDSIKNHYTENLQLLNNQFSIADRMLAEGDEEAAGTIWRTQIVLLASAFDFFMHEIVWYGLDKIYDGDWEKSKKYENITISLKQLKKIMDEPDSKEWFLNFITDKYKTQTIMDFDDVKDHLNLIGINPKAVADSAFYQPNCHIKTTEQMKKALTTLYARRNRIAHQSDRSERDASRCSIEKDEVIRYISDIENIVNAILSEMMQK